MLRIPCTNVLFIQHWTNHEAFTASLPSDAYCQGTVFRKLQNLSNFGIFGICWFITVIATGKDLSPCSASRTSSASTTGPAGCCTCSLYTCSPAVSKWLRHYPEQNSSTQVGTLEFGFPNRLERAPGPSYHKVGRGSSGVTCLLGRATGQPTTFSSREASGESIRQNRELA